MPRKPKSKGTIGKVYGPYIPGITNWLHNWAEREGFGVAPPLKGLKYNNPMAGFQKAAKAKDRLANVAPNSTSGYVPVVIGRTRRPWRVMYFDRAEAPVRNKTTLKLTKGKKTSV